MDGSPRCPGLRLLSVFVQAPSREYRLLFREATARYWAPWRGSLLWPLHALSPCPRSERLPPGPQLRLRAPQVRGCAKGCRVRVEGCFLPHGISTPQAQDSLFTSVACCWLGPCVLHLNPDVLELCWTSIGFSFYLRSLPVSILLTCICTPHVCLVCGGEKRALDARGTGAMDIRSCAVAAENKPRLSLYVLL